MNYSLFEIAKAVDAAMLPTIANKLMPTGVNIDSRMTINGELFICLVGERFDGHDYAAEAVAAGATAVLGSRAEPPVPGVPYLRVADPVAALGRLGRYHRNHTQAAVVGITGTAGKTTTKELLASILALAGPTARNVLNMNNHIGLPLSLLNTFGNERFWIFEIGISKPGEMQNLAAILAPNLALVLNVGLGHLQGLGDIAGVAMAKCDLLRGIAKDGTSLVCIDYPELAIAATATGQTWIAISCQGDAAPYRGQSIGVLPPNAAGVSTTRFSLHLEDTELEVDIPWTAPFFVENVIAAAAAAHRLGLSPEIIHRGLTTFTPTAQRFRCIPIGDWLIIDDTYNANPLSMAAALEGAAALAKGQPLILLLAEMHELGNKATIAHEALGRKIATLAPASIFWHGGHGTDVARGLIANGYSGPWQPVVDPAKCLSVLQTFMKNKIGQAHGRPVLLIKGSRSNYMERYAQRLIEGLAE